MIHFEQEQTKDYERTYLSAGDGSVGVTMWNYLQGLGPHTSVAMIDTENIEVRVLANAVSITARNAHGNEVVLVLDGNDVLSKLANETAVSQYDSLIGNDHE